MFILEDQGQIQQRITFPLPSNPNQSRYRDPLTSARLSTMNRGFYDFPQRRGFRLCENGWAPQWDEFTEGCPSQSTRTWLYLRVDVRDFRALFFRTEDFVRESKTSDNHVVNSELLLSLITEWRRHCV